MNLLQFNDTILPLTEQNDLAIQAQNGNNAAARRLINGNLPLIMKEAHVVHRAGGGAVPLWDIFAVGVAAMTNQAIDNYDPTKGPFLHYAMRWVRMAMRRYSRADRLIPVPAATERTIANVEAGLTPAYPAYAALRQAAIDSRNITSIQDAGATDDQPITQIPDPTPTPDTIAAGQLDIAAIKAAIDKLPPRWRAVLIARYGLGISKPLRLRQVANILGTSRERVRQIQEKALLALRNTIDQPPNTDHRPKLTLQRVYRYDGTHFGFFAANPAATKGEYMPIKAADQTPITNLGRVYVDRLQRFLMLTPAQKAAHQKGN